jgi:two-component system sensor histidine kinase/response regulator
MGGSVGVRSAEGQGSVFWVRLPMAVVEAAPQRPGIDISDASLTAVGFDDRTRRALSSLLDAAGVRNLQFSDATDLQLAPAPAGQRQVLLVNATTDTAGHCRQLAERHPAARIIVAAPRALASTLAAAPDSWAFDAVTLPLRRARVWLAIAAAQGKATLAEVRQSALAATAAFTPPDLATARAAGAAVLVAEDNPTNLHVIRRVLDRAGYAARLVVDGAEAFAVLQSEPGYGLLLTDYHMPEMDGLELTQAVRGKEAAGGGARLPIIVLTADALAETASLVAEAGADGYLTKPLRYEVLRAELERLLPAGVALRRKAASGAVAPPDEMLIDRRVLIDTMGVDDAAAIRDAIRFFWESAGNAPDEFEAAIASGDPLAVREVAHAMKGTTASVGAQWLSDICREAELAARAGEIGQAAACAPRIRAGFERLGAYIATLAVEDAA